MNPVSLWGKPYASPLGPGPLDGLPPGVRSVIQSIAQKHNIPVYDVMSQSRLRPIVRCRWEIWSILKDEGRSYPRVGGFFHKDHTTVLYGVTRHRALQPRLEAAE